jgi:hypothetical protein
MKKFYMISSMYQYGKFILLLIPVIIVLSVLVIPPYQIPQTSEQYFTVNGNALKYDDTIVLKAFFESIRKNNGVLCLGTSESTSLEAGNYYDFLNNDSTISTHFSVLSGAGRTCGIYEWMMIEHPEWFNGLQIIYMVNPAYWRADLCKLNLEYWNRYNNYYICQRASRKLQTTSLKAYFSTLNIYQKISYSFEYFLKKVSYALNQNLKYNIMPHKVLDKFSGFSAVKSPLQSFNHFSKPNNEVTDTIHNVDKDFSHFDWLKPIDEQNKFRYEELNSFITISKKCKANVKYIICPYNEQFLKKKETSQLDAHENWRENILKLFDQANVSIIDATDISKMNNTFTDHQHYNSYAAYLIYMKLKPYYVTK